VAIAKPINPDPAPPIATTVIHRRRCDRYTDAREKPVVMMVMVVVMMVELHQLKQRLGPLSLDEVICGQDRLSALNRLEQVGVGVCCGYSTLDGGRLCCPN
jgi:hypothetical protein